MTQTPKRRFSKAVAIKEVDRDERTATGAVLVPWEVDRQDDWLRPEGVEAMFNPDPEDGVMHAAFPDDAAELVENFVTREPIELGGEEFPPGTWVATRQYHDDDLWELVDDGILTGFSIGGEVTRQRDHSVDELPSEVSFPDGGGDDTVTEIVNGATEEVSDVDIPAVPRAVYATAKSLGKNLMDRVSGEEEFVQLMQDRGHSEEDARRLYEFLEDARDKGLDLDWSSTEPMDSDKTDSNPDAGDLSIDDEDVGFLKRLRKAFTPTGPDDGELDIKSLEVSEGAFAKAAEAADVAKEGRSLNRENREALMAAHDAIEAALASEMDHEWNRFTDDVRFDFDVANYGGGEGAKFMTEDNDLTETVEALEEKVSDLTEKLEEAEGGSDDTEKADEQDGEELAAKLDALTEKMDALDERVDKVSKATADTDQLGGGDGGEEASAKRKAIEIEREVFTR